ncbi:unnamed protein product [Schistosoma curassoni]|uniref:WS_DGAT_C domain-containing protein n=1 Tax=Schistosoma curassoni TaxID=6186 RepID=A0A183KRA6_9TREM|nr:unnamed protein product [Schistosoma curassoni]
MCSVYDVNKFATIGDTGDPMAASFICSQKLPFKVKNTAFLHSLMDFIVELEHNELLLNRVLSFSSKPLTKSLHSSIEMLVCTDTTS